MLRNLLNRAYPLALLMGLLLLGVAALAEEEAKKTDPELLGRLQTALQNTIKDFYEEAGLTLEGETLTAQYKTMKFTVHSILKTGEIHPKPHEEVGPNHLGFLLVITLQPGPYQGAAVSNQTLRRPYWETYFNVYNLKGKERFLLVNLSFGAKLKQGFLEKVKATLATFADTEK